MPIYIFFRRSNMRNLAMKQYKWRGDTTIKSIQNGFSFNIIWLLNKEQILLKKDLFTSSFNSHINIFIRHRQQVCQHHHTQNSLKTSWEDICDLFQHFFYDLSQYVVGGHFWSWNYKIRFLLCCLNMCMPKPCLVMW